MISDRAAISSARAKASRSDWREDYAMPTSAITEPNRKLKEALTTGPSKNRQRAFHSAKDYETSASQLGDVVAPPADERTKLRLLVAAHVPPDEIVETLMMLGIHPDQPDWDDGPNTAPTSNRPKGM